MRNLILLSLFIVFTFAGCTSPETTENAANAVNKPANANANAASSTTNAPAINTVSTPKTETVNQAVTLSPVAQAYCDAIRKKDGEALKKVYSAETYKMLESQARDEGKTVIEYLSNEDVGTQPCATRNEQISGDTAIAELTTETYPNGIKIKFVKENGEWKMTNQSPDVPTK